MKIVCIMLLLVCAVPAMGVPADFIGITWDTETWANCTAGLMPYATLNLYLVLYDPAQDVAGVSAAVRIETETVYYGSWTVDEHWENVAEAPELDLELVTPSDPGEPLILAHFPLAVQDSEPTVYFYIEPREGEATPSYSTPDGGTVALTQLGMGDLFDAVVNPMNNECIPMPNESHTWGTVKSLYR